MSKGGGGRRKGNRSTSSSKGKEGGINDDCSSDGSMRHKED